VHIEPTLHLDSSSIESFTKKEDSPHFYPGFNVTERASWILRVNCKYQPIKTFVDTFTTQSAYWLPLLDDFQDQSTPHIEFNLLRLV
jgi:hypothetical protein